MHALDAVRAYWPVADQPHVHRRIRQAFYALCTHVDHQLRILLGTLREEDLLDRTVILFAADHGDMLGDFGLWAKRLFYEGSAAVPMILVGAADDPRVKAGYRDARLVGLQDIMPTLLDMAGVPVPATVEGLSMVGEATRTFLYGECREDDGATRMIHDGRCKLIWYPAGNHLQLFDLEADPRERRNLAQSPDHGAVLERLRAELVRQLNGVDLAWTREGELTGFTPQSAEFRADRGLSGQRGLHFPQPPLDAAGTQVGSP
jgi:arylsulfatase A-like enzyme